MKSFVTTLVALAVIGCAVLTDAIFINRPLHCRHRPCQLRPVWRPRPPVILPPAATPPPVTTTTAPAFEPGFNCQGLADGIYDLGCSGDFVTCLNGVAIFNKCPANLKFDSISGRCLGQPYVAACGGTPTEIPTEPPTTTQAAPPEITPAFAPSEATVLPETTTTYVQPCMGRPSGIYGYGCSKDFVFCSGGYPSWMHCPEPTRFDPVTLKCIPSDSISTCHGGLHHPVHPHINIGEAYER